MDSDDELLITKLAVRTNVELPVEAEDIVKLEVIDDDDETQNNFQVTFTPVSVRGRHRISI